MKEKKSFPSFLNEREKMHPKIHMQAFKGHWVVKAILEKNQLEIWHFLMSNKTNTTNNKAVIIMTV